MPSSSGAAAQEAFATKRPVLPMTLTYYTRPFDRATMDPDDLRRRAIEHLKREISAVSLLDDCSPGSRVAYHTSQYVMSYWDRAHHPARRVEILAELMALMEEGNPRPGQSFSEVVVNAAHRLASREEVG